MMIGKCKRHWKDCTGVAPTSLRNLNKSELKILATHYGWH